jgi:transcription elongation factor GreB
MSKAFTKETDGDDDLDEVDSLPADLKNYVTPHGFSVLQEELRRLMREERPKVVEVVSWAAGNGDRSENGDYIYGKKRLREIDRRVRYLTKRIESAVVVDPAQQQNLEQVFFGATVTYIDSKDKENTVTLVGIDEADLAVNKISWISPVARALMKSRVDDEVTLRMPSGSEVVTVIAIVYRTA